MLAVVSAEDEGQAGLGEHRKLADRLVLAGCGAQTRRSTKGKHGDREWTMHKWRLTPDDSAVTGSYGPRAGSQP